MNEMKVMDYLIIGGVGYLIFMMFKKPKYPHDMYDCSTGQKYIAKTKADHDRMASLGYVHSMSECVIEGFSATEEQVYQASSANQLTNAMSGNAMNQPVTPSPNSIGSRNSSRTLSWR